MAGAAAWRDGAEVKMAHAEGLSSTPCPQMVAYNYL